MNSIECTFSDTKGNHLLVALDFYDSRYKKDSLQIQEEFFDIDIIDINIGKVYLDKPISPAVFFKMSNWLLDQFKLHDNAVFTYVCSIDDLDCNHKEIEPQLYRWKLFDLLFQRTSKAHINVQDVIVGPKDFQTFGRAFYRDKHAPVIHIIAAHLQDKQQYYL